MAVFVVCARRPEFLRKVHRVLPLLLMVLLLAACQGGGAGDTEADIVGTRAPLPAPTPGSVEQELIICPIVGVMMRSEIHLCIFATQPVETEQGRNRKADTG